MCYLGYFVTQLWDFLAKTNYFLIQALPDLRISLPATSLMITVAIIYQAANAHSIKTYAATIFNLGKPKCPISSKIKPINKRVKVIVIAEWINKEPIQKITVSNVQATKKKPMSEVDDS